MQDDQGRLCWEVPAESSGPSRECSLCQLPVAGTLHAQGQTSPLKIGILALSEPKLNKPYSH